MCVAAASPQEGRSGAEGVNVPPSTLSPQVEARGGQESHVAPQSVVANTAPPVENWSAETLEYGALMETQGNELLWSECLQVLNAQDMMYLQTEKQKAKRNPLGYVRNAMIRALMLRFEIENNPKKNTSQPTTAPRPENGPLSHRLLVNDDPDRERKLAEMDALGGLGPVPEHLKIRRRGKKEAQ